jgi:DNA invertase Pin-like site-specific DNA recombinase
MTNFLDPKFLQKTKVELKEPTQAEVDAAVRMMKTEGSSVGEIANALNTTGMKVRRALDANNKTL